MSEAQRDPGKRRQWMRRTHACMLIDLAIDQHAARLGLSVSALLKRVWGIARPELRKCSTITR